MQKVKVKVKNKKVLLYYGYDTFCLDDKEFIGILENGILKTDCGLYISENLFNIIEIIK